MTLLSLGLVALALAATLAGPAHALPKPSPGGPEMALVREGGSEGIAEPGAPSAGQTADPDSPGSGLSMSDTAQRPASIITCGAGYWAQAGGDHATAHLIADKCIAAGFAGAMIWKAQMLEDGAGVPQDPARATALLKQAAESGDPGYAALGKMHYATALHLGRGVERNEAEARKWFEAAAAEGDADAREFLRTGHHAGVRDQNGRGVGTPTETVSGQLLQKLTPPPLPQLPPWLPAVLALVIGTGALRQARARLPMPAH